MKTYSEKLKDPRWQRKRLEIMERDGFACMICDNTEQTLNVHHCYYGKGLNPWEYDNKHLMTLCKTCHEFVEDKKLGILKALDFEVSIMSIHRIATEIDPFLVSTISHAFCPTKPMANQMKCRLASCKKLVLWLNSEIEILEDKIQMGRDDYED